jgi:hypothetical protein
LAAHQLDRKFSTRIAQVESNGNPQALNPHSSATGKYQFLWSVWGNFVSNVVGREITQVEFLSDESIQDMVFVVYERDVLEPEARQLLKHYPTGMSLYELKALVHFKGYTHALAILRGQEDPTAQHNSPVHIYLEKLLQLSKDELQVIWQHTKVA